METIIDPEFDIDKFKKISNVQFDILSSDEIARYATCELTSSKLAGDGTVYDKRMGVITNDENCIVCERNMEICPGHFGYIKLTNMIIHPLYYKYVLNYLKCICYHCHRFILTQDFMEIEGLMEYSGTDRFEQILEYVNKDMICVHCNKNQPKYLYNKHESTIYMFYRDRDHKLRLQPEDIHEIFIDTHPQDIVLLGLPHTCHPDKLIIRNLPVLPPASRPFIISEGKTCDDDLTYKYIEIIKINNKLKKPNLSENKKNQLITSLEFHIKTMFDNTKGKAKQTNGREMKCIKKRLCGKKGLIRSGLSGKRNDFTARTVITGDPHLSLDQMGIPFEIAETLTIPVIVNTINMNAMFKLMENGKINSVIRNGVTHNMKYALKSKLLFQDESGKWDKTDILDHDIIIRNNCKINPILSPIIKGTPFIIQEGDVLLRNKIQYKLRLSKKKQFPLYVGDVVERHLQDGDYVLLNRQPTLHLGSMMAFSIVLMTGKTFRIPLAVTTSFNADFDG
jgi:DNA-directed RNA polymerase beta' subunit